MRLTLLNQFYIPDVAPTGQLAAILARHRASRGDTVTVVTGRGGYVPQAHHPQDESSDRLQVHRVWTPGLGKGSPIRRIVDYAVFFVLACGRLATLPPQDVIISMTTPPFIMLAALLHKRLRPACRVVLWAMDVYPEAVERLGGLPEGGAAARVLRRLNAWMLGGVDHVICLDGAMRRLFLEHYPRVLQPGRVTVIPNFEEADQFPPARPVPEWRPDEPRSLQERFVVLYLGNAGRGHQFDTVIRAAQRLRDHDIVFLFVGGGENWEAIQRDKTERQLDNLVMYGYVPKAATPGVEASAHCGLITLKDRALGVMSPSKLHGYLAMGLPIVYVGPEGSNVDEAIRRFGCGASLRHGEAEALVEYVSRLARDSRFRSELSERARRAFQDAYSDEAVLPQFDDLIEACRQG
jgi:glycosyltransferase involved in cell wall biosynthesis